MGIASILQFKSGNQQYKPRRLYSYQGEADIAKQGWVWKKDDETYDVFVARSATVSTPEAFSFKLRGADPSFPNMTLTLPPDKRYGFARVEGGVYKGWGVNPQYKVGFFFPTTHYTADQTITDVKVFNGDVAIDPGVTLTIEGDVTFVPGVTVTIGSYDQMTGQDAGIVVRNGGSITAEGTADNPITFTSPNPLDEEQQSKYESVWIQSSGSSFDHVRFLGGSSALYQVREHNSRVSVAGLFFHTVPEGGL